MPARGSFVILVLALAAQATCLAQTGEISPAEVEIRLERSGCFGSCPIYSVSIHGDGCVDFVGERFTAHEGPATWTIAREDVVDLLNRALEAHFFAAAPRYEVVEQVAIGGGGGYVVSQRQVTDIPGATLTIRLGDREHSTYLYHGVPEELRELARAVDEVAGTERWVKE